MLRFWTPVYSTLRIKQGFSLQNILKCIKIFIILTVTARHWASFLRYNIKSWSYSYPERISNEVTETDNGRNCLYRVSWTLTRFSAIHPAINNWPGRDKGTRVSSKWIEKASYIKQELPLTTQITPRCRWRESRRTFT